MSASDRVASKIRVTDRDDEAEELARKLCEATAALQGSLGLPPLAWANLSKLSRDYFRTLARAALDHLCPEPLVVEG